MNNSIWEKTSNIVKIGALAFSIVSAGIIANYKVGQLESFSTIHEQSIQSLQMNEVRNDNRIIVLERKAERTDAQLEKLNDNLNALNLSIVELSGAIKSMRKGS